ncbi:proline--tRNA ligase [Sinanaerobacter chloroacetimidivorans]|jgi:prolyl-tRNA synthetase|uniref:Proline--tRNA ligase n=1 Tax=Sinanaerobacter chloroacetimidivorans TaxID=2818044 RepID=A0A8J7W557_9FIRM|nr:proline--tRNA ligase [Sinanaerobacter chloroacetimidivorans]MBR0600471.1 proline--tRNA ligase [Sinanaerobacter chloroacetimidivorans]
MRLSQMYIRTLREVPNEAEIPSHIWLLRAGMIRKLVSGVYGFMPLGFRSIRKIEEIIRQEMDAKGGQEIHMSALQPAELWQESGRWYAYGPEMWRIKDRNEREFCLGPTHEEIFTDIVRSEVSSYRQLPLNLYQIQTKYRDEKRPRFGLMRSREFVMKDAYSFDKDWEGLDKSYRDMYDAYEKVFTRCGLVFRAVEADTGAIGGSASHEFTALSDVGESEIAYCGQCDMAATTERAACVDAPASNEQELPMEKVLTPGTKTIEEVSNFLGVDQSKTIKALLFKVCGEKEDEFEYVAAFIRGDRELNMTKLINALGIPEHSIEFADESQMAEATGCVGGFTGPVGIHDCKVVVDSELAGLKNLVAGACEVDHHIKNVNYGRDYNGDIVTDLKLLKAGDQCPVCGAPVKLARGIEVGQVFKLGTKYSKAMGAYYKDENMEDKIIIMGCYGIGVTRTLAAIVEQHHDENGIIWPMTVAPYHAIVTVVNTSDEAQTKLAETLYQKLLDSGVEALIDDRNERPGVKFKDADILGIPVRITVGKKAAEGMVEFKLRRDKEIMELSADEALEKAVSIIKSELK